MYLLFSTVEELSYNNELDNEYEKQHGAIRRSVKPLERLENGNISSNELSR